MAWIPSMNTLRKLFDLTLSLTTHKFQWLDLLELDLMESFAGCQQQVRTSISHTLLRVASLEDQRCVKREQEVLCI